MEALFGFLTLIALIGVVVSLIKPKLILPKAENPSRLKAFASSLVVLLVVLGAGVAITPAPEADQHQAQATTEETKVETIPATPVTASTEEIEPLVVHGIGISKSNALEFFTELGFAQEQGMSVDGQEKWVGKSGTAISEVQAIEDEASSMGLMLIFSQNEEQNTTNLLRMVALAKFTVPDWENSLEWMSNAIQAGGNEIVVDGRQVSMTVARELNIAALSIKAAD
ncbi:hypothetical protein [Telmatospirillum sp. J64-1]|uniref:hypothetical protein n=1 Tax=Telmatospirillum sp. J64-1 TaxID=2502183 RepID=UPI00115E415A|nr:hypothetical protein [Telmatospirillum sp. J64-1]